MMSIESASLLTLSCSFSVSMMRHCALSFGVMTAGSSFFRLLNLTPKSHPRGSLICALTSQLETTWCSWAPTLLFRSDATASRVLHIRGISVFLSKYARISLLPSLTAVCLTFFPSQVMNDAFGFSLRDDYKEGPYYRFLIRFSAYVSAAKINLASSGTTETCAGRNSSTCPLV